MTRKTKTKKKSTGKHARAKATMKRLGLKGFNKPKRINKGGKAGVVMAKEGDKTKLIRFGSSASNGKRNKTAAQRKRFRSRHRKNIKRGKMSAAYWANRVLWPGK